jgi:Flp pilus assembly CpaE family ATPase
MQGDTFTVLLIEDNPGDARLIREHLSQSGTTSFVLEWTDHLSKGLERIEQGDIDLVLLDLMLPDSRGLETLLRTRAVAPDLPIILLTGVEDEELAVQTVREGAQDFLIKGEVTGPLVARSIRYAIERQRQTARPNPKPGRILGFIGAKGGVGTTTIALNVASVLARHGRSVIAVELRSQNGSFCHYLREAPAANLSALAPSKATLSTGDVQARLYKLSSGLRVLFGPQKTEEYFELEPEFCSTLLSSLASLADYVIVDFPSQISPGIQAGLRQCSFVALVTEPEPVSLSSAKVTVANLSACGLGSGVIGAIVNNRALLSNPLRLADIKVQLECGLLGVVPPAADLFFTAHSSGTPLAIAKPDSNPGSVLTDLAMRMAADPVELLRA